MSGRPGGAVPGETLEVTASEAPWPAEGTDGQRSALYEGTLLHRRFGPGPEHSFRYPVAICLLDLAEVDQVTARHPWASQRHPAPLHFRRRDFLGDPALPLDHAVRDLVECRTGRRPDGPVALLANLRTWGWLFNPNSLYFCAGPAGSDGPGGITHLVAEVQNTPWHERTTYVVGEPGEHRFPKALHVSPFLPMEVDYRLRYGAPGPRLDVSLDVLDGTARLFTAHLSLHRRPLDRASIGRLLRATPLSTHRVSAGIYLQAARLHRRGAPFFTHPSKRLSACTAGPVGTPTATARPTAGPS
ncbi:MAG: DUF1365 domain-containing protein [Acidimicrobiales bacterium]